MGDLLLDLLLPKTDRAVNVQWAVMTPVWALIIWRTWRLPHELRLLVWGLAIVNLAWFMLRMAH